MKKWLLYGGMAAVGGVAFLALTSKAQAMPSTGRKLLDTSDATVRLLTTTADNPGVQTGYWGRWAKNTRPKGLPVWAASVGAMGDAVNTVREVTAGAGDDAYFASYAITLCKHESGATHALPAIQFNVLPPDQRNGATYCSAWGCFGYNRDAYRGFAKKISWVPNYVAESPKLILGVDPVLPLGDENGQCWNMSRVGEVVFPLNQYRQIYKASRDRGFTPERALIVTAMAHSGLGNGARIYRAGPGGYDAAIASLTGDSFGGAKHWYAEAKKMAQQAIGAV
jgi:hypothetical protein